MIDHRGDQREGRCLVLACLLMSWLGCGGHGAPGIPTTPPPPPAVDLPPEPRLKYGVHISDRHFPDRPWLEDWLATVAKDKEIGAQVSRLAGLWNQIESTQGDFNWGFDLNVDSLVTAGIDPLVVIRDSPSWASGSSDPSFVPTSEPEFTRWLSFYRTFVRALATRYKGRVKDWELWNEPNVEEFWKPAPNLDAYARWASAIESEIRAIDPNARVAYGSLTVIEVAYPPNISGKEFLRGLYTRGISPRIVSVHPYAIDNAAPETAPGGGRNTFRDVETIRQVMLQNGGGSGDIWITEYSWWAGPSYFDPSLSLTEEEQADYLGRSLALARSWPYVTRVIWFWDWDVPGSSPWALNNGAGLARADGSLRPAALTFRSAPR